MALGFPAALLLLAAGVSLILFLHSLKPKGVKVNTTTLFIWERVLRDQPLRTRLGWLMRKNVLLLLQIIAAALLALALADPSLLHFGAGSGDIVVVIDLSASMKTRGHVETRFEGARTALLREIDGLSAGQRMMIIGGGPEPRLIVPLTADKKRLREAARDLSATDAPGRVKDAILLAHSFVKRDSSDRVVAITDGAFTGVEEFSRPAVPLRVIQIVGGKNNIGIVGFEARRYPDHSLRMEIMARVKNFTAKAIQAPLTLYLGDRILAREIIAIAAGDERVVIFPFERSPSGTVAARLEVSDDFDVDNQALLVIRDAPPMRLLYVGPGNPFLTRLLRLFPNVEVTMAAGWQELGTSPPDHDVLIFDRTPVPPLVEGNVMVIGALPENIPLRQAGKIRQPRIVTRLTKHPVTEGVDLADLRIREALRLVPSGEGQVLARSQAGPLLFALESGKLRLLLFAFDLTASDLPLRVAFPVLFHNALQWLHPQRLEFPGDNVPAGTPFTMRLPVAATELQVTTPSGRREIYQPVSSRFVFPDTLEAGLYHFKSARSAGQFVVNLLDQAESQINPGWNFTASAPAPPQGGAQSASRRGFDLWPMLMGAGVLVLMLEFWLAYRAGIWLTSALARGIAIVLAGLALMNFSILRQTSALDVVLSVDLSRSVGYEAQQKAREILDTARRFSGPETRTGLLFFGRAPEWESLPRIDFPAGEFGGRLDREETDIEAALQAGLAQMHDERQKRILLISDGNENRGAISRILPLLRSQGAEVWTVPASLASGKNELYVSELSLPQTVDSAETFEVKAVIETVRPARAHVQLLRDGTLHAEREIDLHAAANTVTFRDFLREQGSHSYELMVESEQDTLAENNLLHGAVHVKGPPRVLLISAADAGQRFIARVLETQGYHVVNASAEAHPLSVSELASFDLVVLDNVPAFQLAQAKMESIEKYVRDLGGGLLVIGGAQSYGAGGYYRTPLERILPLDMRPPARVDFPHVALLFVLDKSGSMGAGPEGSTKLDLAKAAAIAAADVMNPTDQVGILAFDAGWEWALPFRAVGKGEWIADRLADLQSDGGTDLYKAMLEAQRAIAGKQAAIKHILILSDGLTDKADFQALVQQMIRDNVTISTVSVGADADVQLMADIAKAGKGRGYVALDAQTVPQIFTTETLLISRDLLVEKPTPPSINVGAGPLKGIDATGLPVLGGYVLTYPKPRSEILMQAGKDPLLASWRLGIGRVTAYTSDLSGRWGREWVTWQGFPRWASQIARHTMRQFSPARTRVELKAGEQGITVTADLKSENGDFLNQLKLKAKIAAPERRTVEQIFEQTAPGRYVGTFIPAHRGIHFVTLYAEQRLDEATTPLGTFPYIVPYPKEYRVLTPNLSLLSRLAEATSGEMLDTGDMEQGVKRLYAPASGKALRGQQTWWPLGLTAFMVFLMDLVFRIWPRWRRAV